MELDLEIELKRQGIYLGIQIVSVSEPCDLSHWEKWEPEKKGQITGGGMVEKKKKRSSTSSTKQVSCLDGNAKTVTGV